MMPENIHSVLSREQHLEELSFLCKIIFHDTRRKLEGLTVKTFSLSAFLKKEDILFT